MTGANDGGVAAIRLQVSAPVLGVSLIVRDPSDKPADRSFLMFGKEKGSTTPIIGHPDQEGATLRVFADGTTSTNQTFMLPAGAAWEDLGKVDGKRSGFKYLDQFGVNGPVKLLLIQRTNKGGVEVTLTISGENGMIDVVPPNVGTSGGMRLEMNGNVVNVYRMQLGAAAGGLIGQNNQQGFTIKDAIATSAGC